MGYGSVLSEAAILTWLLRVAMRDLMPPTGSLPGIENAGLDTYVRQVRQEAEWSTLATLVLGAFVVVVSPILTVYLPLPSVWLPARLRERHIEKICATPFYLPRQAVFLLKMYACFCWGQDPQVRALFALKPYPPDPATFRTT